MGDALRASDAEGVAVGDLGRLAGRLIDAAGSSWWKSPMTGARMAAPFPKEPSAWIAVLAVRHDCPRRIRFSTRAVPGP